MAQGNFTWQRGDITGDIYFDYLRPQNQDPVPYVRLYLMIDGSPEAKPVKMQISIFRVSRAESQAGISAGVSGGIPPGCRGN